MASKNVESWLTTFWLGRPSFYSIPCTLLSVVRNICTVKIVHSCSFTDWLSYKESWLMTEATAWQACNLLASPYGVSPGALNEAALRLTWRTQDFGLLMLSSLRSSDPILLILLTNIVLLFFNDFNYTVNT
jgi:hypothetical protein